MRKTALIIWGGVALAACAPLNTYYKPGATVAMVERQTTQCRVDALAQVPVVLQTRAGPPQVEVTFAGGARQTTQGRWLDTDTTAALFAREGRVAFIEVAVPETDLTIA